MGMVIMNGEWYDGSDGNGDVSVDTIYIASDPCHQHDGAPVRGWRGGVLHLSYELRVCLCVCVFVCLCVLCIQFASLCG